MRTTLPPPRLIRGKLALSTFLVGTSFGVLLSGKALAQSYPAYDPNTTYSGGDVVTNGGLNYVCNSGVTVAWCSGAAWAYEPGVGAAWDQAWSVFEGESSGGTSTDSGVADSQDQGEENSGGTTNLSEYDHLPAMSADNWSAGDVYTGGMTAAYDGLVFKAEWWTQGDQPDVNNEWGVWRVVGVAGADGDGGQDDSVDQDDPLASSDSGGSNDSTGSEDQDSSQDSSYESSDQDESDESTAESSEYPAYEEGVDYEAGAIVSNVGSNYRCNDGGTSAWCGGVSWAYAPGEGTAWQDAWSLYTGQSGSSGSGGDSGTGDDTVSADAEVIALSTLLFDEAQLTSDEAFQNVVAATRTIENDLVEQVAPGLPTNPSNVQRVEMLMSDEDFEFLFPERAPEYSYLKFLQAVAKFPAYCGDYDDGRDAEQICRVSLATTFAHFAQETGGHAEWWEVPEWRQALVHVREMGWNEGDRGGYNGECNPDVWQGQTWPCGTYEDGEFKSYFGRGAKQLSYNYNYGPFSEAMFGDVRVLLDSP